MNPLVLQIIGVLVILFFIFMLVMCWKTWRIAHILFAFCAFGAAVTFLGFASCVLKTHAAWRSLYERYDDALEAATADRQQLLNGNLAEAQQTDESVRSLKAKFADVIVDRGRVWRECTLRQPIDGDTFLVSTVPASLPQNEQPQPNGIADKQVLQVFAERDSPDGWKVPGAYLGEFKVDQRTDTEVTISATLPLDPRQQQAIQRGGTWALYEIMPIDAHEPFAWYDEAEKLMVGMDKQELQQYIPNQNGLAPDVYDELLQRYYRFDREATEDDPPENVWLLVEFLQPHKFQVDSDAENSLIDNQYFDSSGRALVARLRRGGEGTVEFEIGQTAIFDQATGNVLVDDGVCRIEKRLYRRKLNDYQYFFHHEVDRHVELDNAISQVQRDTDEMIAVKTKAEEQLVYRQQEKVKLEEDLVNIRKEQADVTQYANALEQEWLQVRLRLKALYAKNAELVAELTKMQLQMAAEINRRTLQSTAQADDRTAAR